MYYLYKIYNNKLQKYDKYIITNEENTYDTSNVNLIHIFKELSSYKKEQILFIINKKLNDKEEINISNILDELKI